MDHRPSPDQLAELKNMRSFMQRMVKEIVAGRAIRSADIQELNKIMSRGAVTRQLKVSEERYQLTLSAVSHDWPQVMAEIAASFAHILVEAEPSRIRICDNPDCRWIYYDDTRNHSKKYCDDKMCGNLMKVRRFRARKKAAGAAPSEE